MKRRRHSVGIAVSSIIVATVMMAWAPAVNAMDEEVSDEQGPPLLDETDSPAAAKKAEGDREKLQLPAQKHIKVVQNRLFTKKYKHLLEPYFGINPSDSLYFSTLEGLRYNFYFSEELGLQLNFAYVQNFGRDLKNVVEDGLKADAASLVNAKMQFFFNADFLFVPVYGKFSLFAEAIAHYDIGLYLGAGAIAYKKAEPKDVGSAEFKEKMDIRPAIDAGVFSQIYILNWLSVRLDFTYYYSIADFQRWDPTSREGGGWVDAGTASRHNYILSLGVGFLLPPGP